MSNFFSKSKQIGIMGGAFNPFHHGHLRHAIEVFEKIPLSYIEILPSAHHPHKRDLLPFEFRVKCIEKAIYGIDFLKLNTLENSLPPPSYTDKILTAWRAKNPLCSPYFLLGTEDFNLLHSWHNGFELLTHAHLLIVSRNLNKAEQVCQIAQKYWGKVFISFEDYEILPHLSHYEEFEKVQGEKTVPSHEQIIELGFNVYQNQDLSQVKKLHIAVENLGFCTYLDIPFLDITATQIRKLWNEKKCLSGLIPAQSLEILEENTDLLKKYW